MSSATVLFVLKDILDGNGPTADAAGERVCSMAFGPGLTVETSLMTLVPGSVAGPASGAPAVLEPAAGLAAGELAAVPAPDASR
jgi:hypothetical protein